MISLDGDTWTDRKRLKGFSIDAEVAPLHYAGSPLTVYIHGGDAVSGAFWLGAVEVRNGVMTVSD